jgi:putative transcriptional regulator
LGSLQILFSISEISAICGKNLQNSKIHHRNRIPMKDSLFQELAASLKEGGAILRGKKKAARSTTLQWPDAKAVRNKLGFSQTRFAALIGISPRTLQNWEQGHRRPEGTARALLRVAESHPEAVLEALHR